MSQLAQKPKNTAITKAPDGPDTLDFQTLLKAGIEAAQAFSGADWTDYNAHDPGITILETLVFALTDIAYRTQHPIADILASSAKSTGTPSARQPLFPGTKAFTTAPVTARDYRKLLYDQVTGLRNAWLLPAGPEAAPPGLMDVWLQPFAPEDPTDLDGINKAHAEMERKAQDLLGDVRGLGVDFRHIRVVPTQSYALQAELTLAPETDLNSGIARMLLAVDTALNPPPVVADLDTALASGQAPETVFDGPELEVGLIPDDSLRAPRLTLDLDRVRAAMLALPQIQSATGVTARFIADAQDVVSLSIPGLSRNPGDLTGLRVYRRGAAVRFDPDQVLIHMRHLEETQRWDERYAIRRTADTAYARIPSGNPDRDLARYRSIQHMFPGIYGIGPDGVSDSSTLSLTEMADTSSRAQREARARQLKGYLVIFEQMMADHLGQLNATADLLALPSDRPTYATLPLTRPAPTPDDAPDLAPVLGQDPEPGPLPDTRWYDHYVAGLGSVRDAVDRPLERRNRALDHLLARFGETINTEELKRLYDDKTAPRADFESWLLARKASLLRDVIDLGRGRGLGLDLAAPETCPLPRRIALRSGHDAPIYLIEHILLRDDGLEAGIGTAQIGTSFAISAPLPHTAVRLAVGARAVHWVLAPSSSPLPSAVLRDQLAELGADPAHYQVHPERGYGAVVRIGNDRGLTADVVERFATTSQARVWVQRMVMSCRAAHGASPEAEHGFSPVLMPLDFAARGASLILAPGAEGTTDAQRAYVADIAAQEMPAHVLAAPLWLDPDQGPAFAEAFDAWRSAQLSLRRTSNSSERTRQTAADASQALRRWIHDLFCAALRDVRRQVRRDGTPP